MKKKRTGIALAVGTVALVLLGTVFVLGWKESQPIDRLITVEAQQYGYTPAVIKVNKGDRVTLRLKARDVTHGFFLESYDLDAKARPEMPAFWVRHPSHGEAYQEVEEISFVADKEGKFRYRCSTTCGYMHPFMQGELIVQPNRLFPASVLAAVGLTISSLFWFARKEGQ